MRCVRVWSEGRIGLHDILNKMQECLIGKRDNRMYNSLIISAYIQTLPEGHIIVDRLIYYFEVGKKYTPAEILIRMNLFLAETGYEKKIDTQREATRMLNNFRGTYRKWNDEDEKIYYHIRNDNPRKIVNLKKRTPLDQDELITKE